MAPLGMLRIFPHASRVPRNLIIYKKASSRMLDKI